MWCGSMVHGRCWRDKERGKVRGERQTEVEQREGINRGRVKELDRGVRQRDKTRGS